MLMVHSNPFNRFTKNHSNDIFLKLKRLKCGQMSFDEIHSYKSMKNRLFGQIGLIIQIKMNQIEHFDNTKILPS